MQLPNSVAPGRPDLGADRGAVAIHARREAKVARRHRAIFHRWLHFVEGADVGMRATLEKARGRQMRIVLDVLKIANRHRGDVVLGEQRERSEEHTSELQSLMRISYAVFCLKKQNRIYEEPTIHTVNY